MFRTTLMSPCCGALIKPTKGRASGRNTTCGLYSGELRLQLGGLSFVKRSGSPMLETNRNWNLLRTLLCRNQTKWEMKIFDPDSNLALRQIFRGGGGGGGGVPKRPSLTFLLHCCHGNIRCLLAPQTPIWNSEPAVKSAKCKTPFLKSINTRLQNLL